MAFEGYLTVDEVAERLAVHKNTVYKMIKSGQLKARKHNREWMIKPKDVDKCPYGEFKKR